MRLIASQGPWTAQETGDGWRIWHKPSETYLADVFSRVPEADARLIAAAPEMLKLLRSVADLWVGDPNHPLRNGFRAMLKDIEEGRP